MLRVNMESPPLYDEVHQLAVELVNSQGRAREHWAVYERLKGLCESNEESVEDHPFQWETLADFTTDDSVALLLYEKALRKAEDLGLAEYTVSIQLAMAQRHFELGQAERAWSLAVEANGRAQATKNLDLRREISELLLEISRHT